MKEVSEIVMLPEGSVLLNTEEMIATEGGAEPLTVAVVMKAVAAAGAMEYGAFRAIGERLGYKYSKDDYKKIKWPLRAALMGYTTATGCPLAGGLALLGFETGFYSTSK